MLVTVFPRVPAVSQLWGLWAQEAPVGRLEELTLSPSTLRAGAPAEPEAGGRPCASLYFLFFFSVFVGCGFLRAPLLMGTYGVSVAWLLCINSQ